MYTFTYVNCLSSHYSWLAFHISYGIWFGSSSFVVVVCGCSNQSPHYLVGLLLWLTVAFVCQQCYAV